MADQTSSSLEGKRVVITRATGQSGALAQMLRDRGSEVISLPLIQIIPPADLAPLDAALRELGSFDWTIFTSQNAVAATADRLAALEVDFRTEPSTTKIAAVGRATAEAAEFAGFRVAHVGQGGTAATLVYELAPELPGKRVLLPRSDRAAAELLPRLQKFGAIVSDVIAYHTSYATDVELASKGAVANSDAILFFSPSAVHAFEGLLKSAKLSPLANSVVVGAIGPVTSVALRNAGLRCDFQASEPSTEDLVATLAVHFEKIKVPSVSGANS